MVYDFVIAGGSGYLGSALTRQLLKAGATVRVFGRIAPDFRHPNLDFVVGDIRDSEAVRRACRGGRTLFHLIAQLPLAKDAQLVWSVNRDGTRTLLGAALRAGIQKVVYTSTF